MRFRCLPVVLLAILALAGCVRPRHYAVVYPATTAPNHYHRWSRPQPTQVLQYRPAPVRPSAAAYAAPAPAAYRAEPPYTLDSGDRLRIVVFGQQNLSSTYIVDASGRVAMPLIGAVPARGLTPQQLAHEIANKLRRGYVREPHVTAEVVQYRPFFILGEVNNPGQYPYVAHMTVETAVAIAGGYSPRADKGDVAISRTAQERSYSFKAPSGFQIRPGDTIRVKERWF